MRGGEYLFCEVNGFVEERFFVVGLDLEDLGEVFLDEIVPEGAFLHEERVEVEEDLNIERLDLNQRLQPRNPLLQPALPTQQQRQIHLRIHPLSPSFPRLDIKAAALPVGSI